MVLHLWISLLVLPPNTTLLRVLRPANLSPVPFCVNMAERALSKLVNLAPCRCERVKQADGAGIHRSVQPAREKGEAAKWALSGTFSHQRLPACGRQRSWLYLWAIIWGAELHFLHGTLLWAVCVGERTVKACHQEPPPPLIYRGRMCFGGLDESLFPEPYVCWLRLGSSWNNCPLSASFLLQISQHCCHEKKKNHTSIKHASEFNLLLNKERNATYHCFIFAASCHGIYHLCSYSVFGCF